MRVCMYAMAWYSILLYVRVCYGMSGYVMVSCEWHVMVYHGMLRCITACYGMLWCVIVCYGIFYVVVCYEIFWYVHAMK